MNTSNDGPSPWLHRWAVLLNCLVWPLVWIGGLVTTEDAGMAVPDWPTTYGYNMFLYPIEWWLSGPFDLFIEHGHRQLASVVGFVAIGTLIVAIRVERRRWVVVLTAATLVAVILQGVLGGFRVVLDQRTLAMIHGIFAQVFFALCTSLAVVTSRWWWRTGEAKVNQEVGTAGAIRWRDRPLGRSTVWLAGGLAALAFVQLALGAQLRHLQVMMAPAAFSHLVLMHLATAVFVWVISGILAYRLWGCGDLTLSRPAKGLVGLVAVQIGLGLSTWVAKYGLPAGSERWSWVAKHVIESKGFFESMIVTGHVATGSLLIACSVMLWLRALRASKCWASEGPVPARRVSEREEAMAVPEATATVGIT